MQCICFIIHINSKFYTFFFFHFPFYFLFFFFSSQFHPFFFQQSSMLLLNWPSSKGHVRLTPIYLIFNQRSRVVRFFIILIVFFFSISSSYLFLVYRVFLDIPSQLDHIMVTLLRFKLVNQVVFGLVKSIISIQRDSYNVQFKTQTR